MATRLNLADDMLEFTFLVEVAQQAGVSPQAVHGWLNRQNLRRHCRPWGRRQLLLPLPVVRLYLHERCAPQRPRGWWGRARTADHLGVSVQHVSRLIQAGCLDAVKHGGLYFIDPHSIPNRHTMPQTSVRLTALAAETGERSNNLLRHMRRAGCPVTVTTHPRQAYTTAEAARRFLTARGHREELVETYLRRVLVGEAAKSPR